jgi:hypothetical protein
VHLPLMIEELPALKSDLRRAHLNVSATRRIEGAARGLRFGSYATLRAALQEGPCVVQPDDDVFATYVLHKPDGDELCRTLSRALARAAVRRVMQQEPQLTERGYDSPYARSSEERKMSHVERRAAFARRRDLTLGNQNMDEFELAWIYLAMQQRRKTINFDFGSYGLKHRAENLSRKYGMYGHLGNYVSNGMFIIAAIASGFQAKQMNRDLNACFNISSKSIRATAGHPVMTRRQQGRLLGFALSSLDAEPWG